MKIGNIEFKNGIFLAPLAGVADTAFRHMCKKHGAQGVCTEMISAKAVMFGDKKTEFLAKIDDYERPCAIQIFGSEPETMAAAAKRLLSFSPEYIDINMGCPVKKVCNCGEGSALLKDEQKAYKIMCALVRSVGDRVPVTVKIRSGFDHSSINAVKIASLAQKAGISAVFVHARTREQMYCPGIDLSVIRDVKQSVDIPVIGNGDIFCAQDAKNMLEKTGCDGIMVARGALGNPYIFRQINDMLCKKDISEQSDEQLYADICEHLELLCKDKGEFVGVREARKHAAWYIKGRKNSASIRNEINNTESREKILELVKRAIFEK